MHHAAPTGLTADHELLHVIRISSQGNWVRYSQIVCAQEILVEINYFPASDFPLVSFQVHVDLKVNQITIVLYSHELVIHQHPSEELLFCQLKLVFWVENI